MNTEEIRAALDADDAWRFKRALAGIRCRCPIRYDQSHNQDCPFWLVNWRWPQLIAQLREALAEIADLQASADLRHKADERAIRQWQAAHPGNDARWPDHADLVVWLMEQNALLKGTIAADDERLRKAGERVGIEQGCDTAEWMADEIERLRKQARERESLAADTISVPAEELAGAIRHMQTVVASRDAEIERLKAAGKVLRDRMMGCPITYEQAVKACTVFEEGE